MIRSLRWYSLVLLASCATAGGAAPAGSSAPKEPAAAAPAEEKAGPTEEAVKKVNDAHWEACEKAAALSKEGNYAEAAALLDTFRVTTPDDLGTGSLEAARNTSDEYKHRAALAEEGKSSLAALRTLAAALTARAGGPRHRDYDHSDVEFLEPHEKRVEELLAALRKLDPDFDKLLKRTLRVRGSPAGNAPRALEKQLVDQVRQALRAYGSTTVDPNYKGVVKGADDFAVEYGAPASSASPDITLVQLRVVGIWTTDGTHAVFPDLDLSVKTPCLASHDCLKQTVERVGEGLPYQLLKSYLRSSK